MASILCVLLLLGNFFVFGYGECPDIISRKDWSKLPTAVNPVQRAVPVDTIMLHERGSHFYTVNPNSCKEAVLEIQKNYIRSAKHSDILYNFLICEDGEVYEGRGWDETAPSSNGYYTTRIGIALIGDFTDREPSQKAWNALTQLIECGVGKEKIKDPFRVIGYGYKRFKLSKLGKKIKKYAGYVALAKFVSGNTGVVVVVAG